MAEAKKKDSKKIVDVAHPGKTAPSENSKSVIVGHGPMIKDPMVVGEGQTETAPAVPEKVSVKTGEAVIAPLADSEVAKDAKSKKAKENNLTDEKLNDSSELKEEDDKKTIAVLAEEAAVKKEEIEEATDEAPVDLAAPEVPIEEAKSEEAEEPKLTNSVEESAAEKEDDKEDIGTDEKAATQSVAEADAEELAIQEKHDAEIQKLIDSKTYSLPIKTVEQRRSKRVVILGVFISLVLGLAWLNIALDAGLVQVSGVPHTNFFDQQGSDSTVLEDSIPVTKSYTTKVSKLTFKYPVDWVVFSADGETNDSLVVGPKGDRFDSEKGKVDVTLSSPGFLTYSDSVMVKYVKYQKLPQKISGDVYLRDLVYQNNQTGAIKVTSSLSNTNTDVAGSTSTSYTTFLNADGQTKTLFTIAVFKRSDGKDGFASVEAAKDYIKTTEYQKARAILLSTTAN